MYKSTITNIRKHNRNKTRDHQHTQNIYFYITNKSTNQTTHQKQQTHTRFSHREQTHHNETDIATQSKSKYIVNNQILMILVHQHKQPQLSEYTTQKQTHNYHDM